MRFRLLTLLTTFIMIIVACDSVTDPTSTPVLTENPPALELLSGFADTCVITEDYSVVLGFDAIYYDMTTDNYVEIRLLDGDGTVLVEDDSSSENKDGEEGWGFYPLAYELPENSTLTIEVTVFESDAEDAIQSSSSSLTYNCTTGETIDSSFERN